MSSPLLPIRPPRTAATPGPQPGITPVRPPQQPAVAGGQAGRPPAPQPSPVAAPAPPLSVSPTPAAPGAPPATPAQPQAAAPGNLSTAQPQAPVPAAATLARVPTKDEFAALGPGATVQTPFGQMVNDQSGEPKVVLDEAGRAAFTAEKARALTKFGTLPQFATLPGAPAPPVEVGAPNFNVFTGQWSYPDGWEDLQ